MAFAEIDRNLLPLEIRDFLHKKEMTETLRRKKRFDRERERERGLVRKYTWKGGAEVEERDLRDAEEMKGWCCRGWTRVEEEC